MKEVKNDIIKKLSYKDYVVYIKEDKENYECYLQKEDYGILELMFGVSKKQTPLQDFIELVKVNIKDYIETYKQDYEY